MQAPASNRMAHSLTFLLFLGLFTSTSATDVPLDCPDGWTNVGVYCYRLESEVVPWESAKTKCQSYGAKLVKVKDFYENAAVGEFVAQGGQSEYWIGVTRIGEDPTDERSLTWSDGSEATVAVGHWSDGQADIDAGECVQVKVVNGEALWSLTPCERKSPYVCQRPAAPAGSFHCTNGRFVRQGLTCDGEDDCLDGSDEMDCNSRCSYHYKQQTGSIQTPNYPAYPNKQNCLYLIEVDLGYNARLEFTEFQTEPRTDEVVVLAGAKTESSSRMVARLSGNLTGSQLPTYTSNNNFMMVIFRSDESVAGTGFTASFSAVKDETFPVRKLLTARDTPEELTSPFYQASYLGSQDYTWVISAEQRIRIVTLEILEVDLMGDDRILIRDGDMDFDPLLAELTSSSGADPSYVLSTGRDLYITMQTRGLDTGKGFRFRYRQGCQVTLSGISGKIISPGYRETGGKYARFQTCTYNVDVPELQPVTVLFEELDLNEGDSVKIYEGGNLVRTETGNTLPSALDVNSGAFRVVFESDPILVSKGFSITYSVACPDPMFNAQTITTVAQPAHTGVIAQYALGTSIEVSCSQGYAFSAMEFRNMNAAGFQPLDEVTVTCLPGGTWNVRTLPRCKPVYCGKAPPVANGFVARSTGVTYGKTVTYQCHSGLTISSPDNITCTAAGEWTDPPTCTTGGCTALPTTISHGQSNITEGDGTSFGSIVQFTCDAGYQITGSPIRLCGSDGQWSGSQPACEVLKCYVPHVPNAESPDSGQMINYDTSTTVTCKGNYTNDITGSKPQTLRCMADRTLQGLEGLECRYVDKCMEEPDYCNHTCSDSEFGERTCSCMDGYTLDADGRTCNDINECATDNGGCEHNCANSDGSYECSCRQGYSLFVSDGTQGFSLAPNEDGMRPGDVRRFNHSCVPARCHYPEDVPNGERLSNKSSYHYNDEIHYFCNLGYELSGNNPLTCDSKGQWNFDFPQCQIATCLPDTLPPGLLNPAVVSPVAPVNLNEQVTLTCTVPGVGTFTRTRTCVYQDGQYKLMGADYECGLVDCGTPEQQPNSVYLDDSTTTYGSNFTFSCRNQTAPSGGSEESGDTVVRCRSDGLWDFGTLLCEGLTCTDPGRPAGGTQVATFDSYRPGGQVSFQCTQQGFALSNTNPLQCQLNAAGNGVAWNTQDLPECVDTENPVLTGCASEKVLVDRYSPANQSVTIPTFSDNFAVKRFRVTASGTDQVLWPSANYLLSAEVSMFTFTATDFNDNENTCTVVTERRDDKPPSIQCSLDDYTTWREFKTNGQTIGVTFTASDVIVSDDKGTQAPTFNSANGGFGSTFVVTEGNLSKSFPPFASGDYVATVSDTSGNTASCTFEVTFKPESCSPFTLRKPVHGQRDCQETSTGFNCSLTCDTGYVFYDAPDDSSIVRTCVTGEDWPEPQITACVKADGADQDAQFHQVFRFNYTMADDGTQTGCSDLDNYKDLIDRKLPNVVALIPETCNTDDNADRPQGQIEVSSITSDGQVVTVEYTLTYEEREPRIYTQCKGIVAENFIGDFKLNRELRGPFTPNFCPQLEEIAARSTDQGLYYGEIVNPGEYVCQTGKKIMYEGNEVCVTCPEGMQSVGDVCQPCPVGTYNEVAGSTLCTRCTAGSSTFSTGSTSQQECTAVCRPGRFSATGLPPCQMCPKNTYSINSTYCEPCPTNYITRNTGADNQTYCLAPCQPGYYNTQDGHEDCSPCPKGFYADQEGAETCTACSANEETAGEGSTSSQNCTEITACRPGNDPCQNGGTCNLANRDVVCSCPDGYYGQFCQLPIDLCNNNPCYNGGTCQQHGNKYNCSCPTGASGPRCETIAVSCSDSTCENGAVCRNDLNDFTCLCPPGFSGKSCNVTTPICDSNQCENGATCVPLGNVRYRCNCPAGYSGKFCEENIDDCASNPCLHGGTCTDLVDDYSCTCITDRFTGRNCETRLRMCDTIQCMDGACVEDHVNDTYRCVCNPGNENGGAQSLCQDIQYCSQGSGLCEHGGTCREEKTEAQCDCDNGYTGSRCQHDVNDCAAVMCQNGATCRDGFDTFTCECAPGFTGLMCESNIDDCQNHTCRAPGTYNCTDMVNGYKCMCKPGYTGQFCQTDINECMSEPCRHGGKCRDQVNGFRCDCPDGWDGELCENIRQNCLASTCTNSAQCYNLFGDFYCSCLPNTFGKTCSNAPSVCVNANPCLNNSRCTESAGTPMCECTNMYTGEGCQILRDFCSTTDPVCQNGGKCKKEGSTLSCDCAEGYAGDFCQTNIDECVNNDCPSNSTCYDMVNKYYCRCPPGKAGANCEKDVDREFDLLFTHPDKNNMAALAYPLHLSGDGFSITMWVQYMKKFDTGTFFTLYKVPNPNSLAGKEEIIRLDESGLTIALDGNPTMLNTTVEFNQGEWHFIVLSWNRTTGRFSFFVDTIRIPIDNYNQGAELDMYVWMVLGCRYDTATDMCTKGAGFTGHISQVTLYNRELVFREELTLVGNVNPTYVFRDAVMTWGEFLLYPGVTRAYPSKADKSCPKGFQGFPGCTTPVPGKQMVTLQEGACPQDIITYSDKRVTEVNWTFNGGANRVKSSLPSDSVYLWGKHPVVIEAENQDGNKALCSFDIYVRYSECPTPSKPLNAEQVYCAPFFRDEGNRQYRQCSLNCQDDHKPVVAIPDTHTCGPVGSWAPPSMYLPYKLPSCGVTSTPRRRVVVVIVYHVASTECDKVREDLQEQIVLKLQQQNSLWTLSLCKQTSCSDVIIAISCTLGGSAGRRKRQASTPTDVEVTITFDDAPTLLTKTADASVTRTPEDLMRSLVLSGTDFDFSERIADSTPDPNGLEVRLELWCQSPRALIGEVCVECAEGSFYNATTQQCQLCPIGQYQDQAGQTECKGCSSDKTTETEGSTTSNDCKSVCPVGQFYNGDSCADCSVGFFQDEPGLFYCLPCSVDKITRQTGATSESLCFDACPPGKELTPDGSCKDCDIGSYKATSENLCEPCEDGLATNFTGADSKDDCNVADNPPGYYRIRGNETQYAACPIGTYQPNKWQYGCISCGGPRYRTDTEAATSRDECKFFCPAGQERNGTQDSCKPCDVGFYRTGVNPYSSCTPCPGNKRTVSTGATSADQCTIYKCPAGQKPTSDQSDCEDCPRGYYQPLADQTNCTKCPGTKQDTRTTGAISRGDCEDYCDSGYEKHSNGSCVVCSIGYYKDNTIDNFHNCTRCSNDQYVTPSEGATSDSDCTVLDCRPGTYIKGDVCETCPQGTYQDKSHWKSCETCPTNTSTRLTGSTDANDCEAYCEEGYEKKTRASDCEVCPRGYYKNNVDDVFMDCTLCPPDYVTPDLGAGVGATNISQCNVRNCTPGQYISGDNCPACEIGYYQPDWWQDSCIACGTDRTTMTTGATNQSQCILSCPPGKENKAGADVCTVCERGFYKDAQAAAPCTPCAVGFTTRITGATAESACDLRACEPGFKPGSTGCVECGLGTYQPDKWEEDCINCTSGRTTYQTGANSSELCLPDCPSGSKLEGKECVKCPRGQYRNRAEGLPCRDCPTDLTTPADGAVSQDDCTVPTCAVGLFFNSTSRRCETCPKNQYQNQTGQSECKPCPATTSTEGVGKTSPNDCKDNCETPANNCHSNARCVSTAEAVACTCSTGYNGNGTSCKHICDEEGYCINANGCNRITLRCVCRDNYVGDRCDTRTAAQAGLGEKDTMIIAIVVPLILLLIIIVIVIGCILWMRQRHKSKEFIERASERGSVAARMSTRGGYDGTYEAFEAKSAPLVRGQRMMLPGYSNEMYENPVYMPREDPAYYHL